MIRKQHVTVTALNRHEYHLLRTYGSFMDKWQRRSVLVGALVPIEFWIKRIIPNGLPFP